MNDKHTAFYVPVWWETATYECDCEIGKDHDA